jgi:predicted ArsR family transcriptional regulator
MPCCNQRDPEKPKTAEGAVESGPMAMGMAMARRMMGGRGRPMEMMQRMMAQMGQGAEAPAMPQMMQMCMGMCSEMLSAIHQTAAMAAFATPALQRMFGEWLKSLEAKAEAALAEGEKDIAALATALGVDEDSARFVLGRLAADGKVRLIARRHC